MQDSTLEILSMRKLHRPAWLLSFGDKAVACKVCDILDILF